MGFPKVKSFFGINLRTGTLIIAGLSLVGNIVCFFFFLYTLVMDLRFMEVKRKKIHTLSNFLREASSHILDQVERHTPPVMGTISWSTGVGLSIVGMTTTSLLIHGIRTSAWIFFVFWLVWDSLCLTFNMFIFVADVAQAFNGSDSDVGSHQFYLILGNLGGILLGSYFWIVVNSMRREMKGSRFDDDGLLIPEEA